MAGNLMLDPSLLFGPGGTELVHELQEIGEPGSVRFPESVLTTTQEGSISPAVLAYFGGLQTYTPPLPDDADEEPRAPLYLPGPDPEAAIKALQAGSTFEPYSPGPTQYSEFRNLSRDPIVSRILLEEWLWLQNESWVAEHRKRAFSAFIRRGAVALESGRDAFDKVVAKTLHLPGEEVPVALTASQRLRAATKWLAVGGPVIVPLIGPVWASMGAAAASGYFLLFDP